MLKRIRILNFKKISVFVVLGFVFLLIAAGCLCAEDKKKSPWDKAEDLLLAKQYPEAIKLYTFAIETNPDHPDLYQANFNRGQAFAAMEKLDEARADFTEAIRLKPDFKEAYKMRGILNLRTKRYDDAVYDFSRAISLDQKDPYVYANRGTAYSILGRYDEALGDYDMAVYLDPKCASCYYNRYQLYIILGMDKEADENFKKAHDLDSRYQKLEE